VRSSVALLQRRHSERAMQRRAQSRSKELKSEGEQGTRAKLPDCARPSARRFHCRTRSPGGAEQRELGGVDPGETGGSMARASTVEIAASTKG